MYRRFAWARLSLAARLMLSFSATLLVCSSVLMVSSTRGEIERQRSALHDKLERKLLFMSTVLGARAAAGDTALIEPIVRAAATEVDVARIEWSGDRRIVAFGDDARPAVPAWFTRWADIPATSRSVDVIVRGAPRGRLELQLDPARSINQLWQALQRRIVSVGIGAACLLLVTLLILRRALAPLRALAANVQRLGDGDHAVRMAVQGPPEVARSIEAFNTMAANVASLVAALRESGRQSRLHAMLVEQTSDAIYLKDTDGVVRTWNKGAERLYGFSADEALGRTTRETLHRHLNDAEFDKLLQRTRSRQVTSFEARRSTRSGELLDVLVATGPLFDDDGAHLGEIIVARDITELKRAQAALAEANDLLEAKVEQRTAELIRTGIKLRSEADERRRAAEELARAESQLRSIIDAMPGAVLFLDHELKCRVFNRRLERATGLGADRIDGRALHDVLATEEFALLRPHLQAALRGEAATVEWRHRARGGEPRDVETRVVPVFGADRAIAGAASLSIDVTQRRRAELELRASEARSRVLATMVEQSNDAIIGRDLDGRITFWNGGAERLYGYSEREALGQPLRSLHLRDLGEVEFRALRARLRTERPVTSEGQRVSRCGRVIDLSITTAPLLDADGRRTGTVVVQRDITAAKNAERELRRAKDAAEAANRAKSEFLANMSHEIRTPLNGILGLTDLVLDSELTRGQREQLALVQSSGRSLLAILSDILDFSKIEARHLQLEAIAFAPADSIADMVKTMAPRAHEKGLELIYDAALDLPPQLIGDPGRLRQIVTNLLGNAIKFTERGEVAVTVRAQPQHDGTVVLAVGVRDTGIGIAKDKHARIFDPFTQADTSTTRRFGGTGLGLTICARLVELMGGRIRVDSEPGRGSSFAFTLRCGVPAAPALAPPAAPWPKGLGVLVVEDNAHYRQVLLGLLAGWGMVPAAAPDGATAIEMMERAYASGNAYPLLLLDVLLPDLDGYAIAERVQREPHLAGAIIVCTGTAQRGDAARCRELGVGAYLSKPLRPSELFDAIVAVLGRSNAGDAGLVTRHSLREARRGCSILLTEDHDVNQVLATRVLAKLGHRVQIANNGREALEAIEREAFDLVLMDMQMPVMGGLEAAAAIRAREAGGRSRLPIVALTANAMQGDREECLAAGMDDYVTKPFSATQIDAVLERWLPPHGARADSPADDDAGDDGAAAAAAPCSTAAGLDRAMSAALDFDVLRGFIGDDPADTAEFLRMFRTSSAKAAVELRAAHAARRADSIRGVSHRLKASARSVGAIELGELCARLEDAGRHERWDAIDAEMARIEPLLDAADAGAARWLAGHAA